MATASGRRGGGEAQIGAQEIEFWFRSEENQRSAFFIGFLEPFSRFVPITWADVNLGDVL
jgi:hypothetical protein